LIEMERPKNIKSANILVPALASYFDVNEVFTVNDAYEYLTSYSHINALITGNTEHARKCSLGLLFSYCLDIVTKSGFNRQLDGFILNQSTNKSYPKKYFLTK
jgi:hypothetical protein